LSKRVFIVWARYHRRSELLAQHLGATIHYVYHGRMGQVWQAPVRYVVEAWRTWRVLRRERPDVIFVQNPPIFAVVVASLYARCYGAQYVIDSHTGAFLGRRWGWSVGLHRMLSRGALTTLVHNSSQEKIVERWGCRYSVLGFTPGDYPPGEPYPLTEKFNVAVICNFDPDEPLEILFEAAGHLRGVCFYMTGDAQRLDRRLLMKKPENICLTGYLSYERYVGLLRGVSAIMDLVNNEHTLLMGAFEAVSLGVPLIVSDWPLLRDYFSLGTVYIPNTVEGVCEGVRRLRREILLLQEQLQVEWMPKFTELQHLLNEH
jgi:glycosyltransferase involved in cell wall biosynthesis